MCDIARHCRKCKNEIVSVKKLLVCHILSVPCSSLYDSLEK